MTFEEAIKHCEEVAEENTKACDRSICFQNEYNNIECDECYIEVCNKCASEHRQLADWLRELVHLRNITEYLRDMVTCFEFMDSMHYNEDIIEWAESELRVDMREVNADGNSN